MDGSRRRRHNRTAQARWLAVYRTARWARRFMGLALPPMAQLIVVLTNSNPRNFDPS